MKHIAIPFLAATVLSGCAGISTLNQPEPEMLTTEVRALFNEHTVRSYNLNTKVSTWSYYRKDGQLFQERFWSPRKGTWSVQQDGQICLTTKSTSCRFIGRKGDRIYKFKINDKGELEAIIRYKDFVAGNPLQL
ncbi:hypothetical protein [Marinobacterium sediminicola]|uniref:Lipoprotein n=1 Tax=Marinobacterium sediminicola TaxID=518898 RepID=A0ABY1RY21_9GAMM|nr:hypothetical protein [Marinobacterium sediminicola]ULG68581.1 hypothetical protein LN244_12875 [Marinobacterium sediminicola]SMR73099.1 hypothetical protein SAMN04487964_10340 [Marinobacterium sediminicola]